MKNIGKIATSFLAVLLFGCTVENASAAAAAGGGAALRIAEGIHLGGADGITPLDEHDNPVLIAGSDEEALFKALEGKGVDPLTQHDIVAGGVKGLKKYLGHLLREGITADFVRRSRDTRIRFYIQNVLSERINAQYHEAATLKAEEVRKAIRYANICLNTIADAAAAVAVAGDLEAVKNAFANTLDTLDVSLRGDGGLAKVINDSFAGGDGKSGEELEAQRQAIIRLGASLIALVDLAINKLMSVNAKTVKMDVFHDMYEVFCSKGAGGDRFFDEYEVFDPARPENGEKTFKTRYEEWAREKEIAIPNNGDKL